MNMLIFSDKNVFVLSENWITVDFGLPYLKDLYPNISNGSHSLERWLFFFLMKSVDWITVCYPSLIKTHIRSKHISNSIDFLFFCIAVYIF